MKAPSARSFSLERLLRVETGEWREDLDSTEAFFHQIGDRMPAELWEELAALKRRLGG